MPCNAVAFLEDAEASVPTTVVCVKGNLPKVCLWVLVVQLDTCLCISVCRRPEIMDEQKSYVERA